MFYGTIFSKEKRGTIMNEQTQSPINNNPKTKWYQKSFGIVLLLILFFPVGLYLMWKYSNWNKVVKIVVTVIVAIILISAMSDSKSLEDDAKDEIANIKNENNITPTTSPTTEPQTTLPRENSVYGILTKKDLTEINETLFVETRSLLEISYSTFKNKEIYQVEILTKKVPFSLSSDKDLMTEHIFDYMESDSTLVQSESATVFVYHSPSVNKDYKVIFHSDNDDDNIQAISIFQPYIASEDTQSPTKEPTQPLEPKDEENNAEESTTTITIGQQNALDMAKDYLNYKAFSYSGLIKQLEYEKFSIEDASYAADNCEADWNEQAAKMAKEYIDYTSFSRDGLIDQLEHEGFTTEQAEHGATSVGY